MKIVNQIHVGNKLHNVSFIHHVSWTFIWINKKSCSI